MPVKKSAKKTFTKKKVEETKPKKVVKKTQPKSLPETPLEPIVQASPVLEPVVEPVTPTPIEKKVSWLPENSVVTENAPQETPTISQMPAATQQAPIEPAAPQIATSVGPENAPSQATKDTWPNPAVMAKGEPTQFSHPQEVVSTQPEPAISSVPTTAPEEPVSSPQTPTNEVVESTAKPSQDGVLGPSFDGGTPSGGRKKLLLLFVIVFLFVGLLTSGFFYYLSTQKGSLPGFAKAPTPTPAVEVATPTPTVVEEEDLTEYTIEILNGSGKAGEAGKASTLLEDAGFEDIDTGNADSYDYTDTEVQVGKDVPATVYASLEKALSKSYSVVKSKDAPTDSEYDIVVIVGTSGAEDSTEDE